MNQQNLKDFYQGKKVLLTGHTGFKGTWLCRVLQLLGAEVAGYALEPPTEPSLFSLTRMDDRINSYIGDIRDFSYLRQVFEREMPEIVIHMAAQPLVRESYVDPVSTYEINVMGTVNLLECVRLSQTVKSVVNVTTDKVYRNNEWKRGYVETDVLDGYDPYSNSKSCSELVTHSYVQSFLKSQGIAVSACRAGNVIGGGDFARDRIIPDCVRAAERNQLGEPSEIIVRNPDSVRPYQHVLEPLFAYLLVAMEQYEKGMLADCYNVGPEDDNCVTTGELVGLFCELWNYGAAFPAENRLTWISRPDGGPHEANFLKLDCMKLKQTFGWKPKWSIKETLKKIVEFEQLRLLKYDGNGAGKDLQLGACMEKQIEEYMKEQRDV